VHGDEFAAVVLEDPAQAVRLEMGMDQRGGGVERPRQDLLRLEQLGKVRRADRPATLPLSSRKRSHLAMSVAVENAAPAGAMPSMPVSGAGRTRTVSRTMPCGAVKSVVPAASISAASA
jgi:hypothetical protein